MTDVPTSTFPQVTRKPRKSETSRVGWEVHVRDIVSELPRVLGDTGHREGGPLLVCVGGLHGNEPSGVLALRRVLARLAEDTSWIQGRLIGLTGHRRGLAAGRRFLDEDLNRIWLREMLDGSSSHRPRELEEIQDLVRELEVLSAYPPDRAFLLDIHSTSGGGSCFTTLDDTLANRALAFDIPVPHVLGLEEELSGTLISYINDMGVAAIGFEAGQHLDPESVDRAEAAIWIVLESTGVLARGRREEVARARQLLQEQHADCPNVVEVLYRHAVAPSDAFEMMPGFENFQPVSASQPLASDASGTHPAPRSGLILMPLYQGQGADGYFIVRHVNYGWLKLSAALRRLRVDRALAWLPGVARFPGESGTFTVDTHRARLMALQFFHLLGYKRIGRTEDSLIMRKRDARRR